MNKKTKWALGGIAGVVLAGAAVAVGVVASRNLQNDKKLEEVKQTDLYENLNDEEKEEFEKRYQELVNSGEYQKTDDKGKEYIFDQFIRSEEVIHEEGNKTPDKKAEDIVIPEDAPEETKRELQQEKNYWSIIDSVKNIIADKVQEYGKGLGSAQSGFEYVSDITDMYISQDDMLIVEADIVYSRTIAGVEMAAKDKAIIYLNNPEATLSTQSLNNVLEYLSKDTTIINSSKLIGLAEEVTLTEKQEQFIKEKMLYPYYIKGSEIKITEVVSGSKATSELDIYCKVEISLSNDKLHELVNLTVEQNGDNFVLLARGDCIIVKPTEGFSWQEEVAKYSQQSQQVEASVESEVTTASEGFDFGAYKERQSRSKQQTETKTQSNRSLSDGYGIEL